MEHIHISSLTLEQTIVSRIQAASSSSTSEYLATINLERYIRWNSAGLSSISVATQYFHEYFECMLITSADDAKPVCCRGQD